MKWKRNMVMYSYATERKIRILEQQLGSDWKNRIGDKSIDAAYNDVMGDTRKNLFCKIDADIKDKLDIMLKFNQVGMAEFVAELIKAAWSRHEQAQDRGAKQILEAFTQ